MDAKWIYLLILVNLLKVNHGLGVNGGSFQGIQEIFVFEEDFMNSLETDFSLPVPEMVRSYGFRCEIHKYTTSDGYINTLHRIPPRSKSKGQAVFLQHGLLGTSADYVMGRPDKSLGYVLSDLGYDVWLGNARGNWYSREHERLTIQDDAYWKFSFDEMGKYDIPAALDYVLHHQDKRNSKKVFYVGHSMGTTMFWVAMNENHEFMKSSIHSMVALGPVAFVKHVESPIALLSPFVHEIETLFNWMGVREFSPSNEMTQLFEEYVCDHSMRELRVCENFLFLLTGFDKTQMNMTLLPIILGHEPGGTSTQTVIHFAQLVNSGKFSKFDHGKRDNMKYYNQTTPPSYDLKKVDLPVSLIWANNDWLADPKDVAQLEPALPTVRESFLVPIGEFNHVDFIWGKDADKFVFPKIIKAIQAF